MADAVEQALLLPRDMANLRTMKKYKVFLSLKRDLVLINFYFIFFLIAISNHCIFSFTGCSICAHGRGVGDRIPLANEGEGK